MIYKKFTVRTIDGYKWIVVSEQTRIYKCVCSKCYRDFFDFIYGDINRYMFADNLPQVCPNCGEVMVEVIDINDN